MSTDDSSEEDDHEVSVKNFACKLYFTCRIYNLLCIRLLSLIVDQIEVINQGILTARVGGNALQK